MFPVLLPFLLRLAFELLPAIRNLIKQYRSKG